VRPTACIQAYTIVGPMNLKPRAFSAFEIVADKSVCVAKISPSIGVPDTNAQQ
jgi:hypothetical protein